MGSWLDLHNNILELLPHNTQGLLTLSRPVFFGHLLGYSAPFEKLSQFLDRVINSTPPIGF